MRTQLKVSFGRWDFGHNSLQRVILGREKGRRSRDDRIYGGSQARKKNYI